MYGNEFIQLVNQYEYLGIIFDSRGLLNRVADQIVSDADAAGLNTRSLIYQARIASIA